MGPLVLAIKKIGLHVFNYEKVQKQMRTLLGL
jgi:hypothetical protein